MELWDLYDDKRRFTGKTMQRGEPFPADAYHLTVHVCIFNSKGEMLIQRRTDTKSVWPSLWDISAAGSAVSGEDGQAAASRELLEELGISRSFQGVRPHISVSWINGYDDFFVLTEDVPLSSLTLQKEEVAEVRWATKDEVTALLESGKFTPYYRHFLELLFDFSGGKYGCGAKL